MRHLLFGNWWSFLVASLEQSTCIENIVYWSAHCSGWHFSLCPVSSSVVIVLIMNHHLVTTIPSALRMDRYLAAIVLIICLAILVTLRHRFVKVRPSSFACKTWLVLVSNLKLWAAWDYTLTWHQFKPVVAILLTVSVVKNQTVLQRWFWGHLLTHEVVQDTRGVCLLIFVVGSGSRLLISIVVIWVGHLVCFALV